MTTTDPSDSPAEPDPVKPKPIAAEVPKRLRTRLAKAELLMDLAVTADRWAGEVAGTVEGTKPFSEWPDSDPRRQLCHRYALTPADIVRILRALGAELENASMRRGYDEAWR